MKNKIITDLGGVSELVKHQFSMLTWIVDGYKKKEEWATGSEM